MLLRAVLLGFAVVIGCAAGLSVASQEVHYKIRAHFDAIDHANLRVPLQRLQNIVKHERAVESVLRTLLDDQRMSVRIVDQKIHGEQANLPTSWIEAFVTLSKQISREEIISKLHDESTTVVLYHLERVNSVPSGGSTRMNDFSAVLSTHTCFNGGVMLPNGTCVCKQYFEGVDCGTTICNHNGIVTDKNRCSCPPGFVGRHCELMPCLPPVQDTFDFSTRSLIYVVSLRDSMGRDIQQISESTSQLLQKFPAEKFSSFILTTFLAKGSTFAIHTESYRTLSEFQNAIANTVISSGSTLQPSIAAVRDAISKSSLMRPKSSVFVFTDSAALNATDPDFREASSADESVVTRSAIHWGLKVFFFITDSVDYPITSTTDNSYSIYYRIAQNSLGEVVYVGAKKTLGHAFLTIAGYQYDTEAIAVSSNYDCSTVRTENLVIDSALLNKEFFVYTTGLLTLTHDSQAATPIQTVANVNIYSLNSSMTTLSFSGNSSGLCSYKVFVQSLQSVVFGWTVTNTSIDYADGLNAALIPHNGVVRPIGVQAEVVGLSFAALNINDNTVIANSSSKAKARGSPCAMPWIFGEWDSCPPGPFYSQVDVRYMGGKKYRRIVPGFCQIPNSRPVISRPPHCENGGKLDASRKCICKPYFIGTHCEIVECVNGGSQNPYPGGPANLPLCNCPKGYQGNHCETLSCSNTAAESFNTNQRTLGVAFQTTQSTALVGSHVAGALQNLTAYYNATFTDVYFDSFVFTSFADSEISSTSFNNSDFFIDAVQSAKFRMSTLQRQNVFAALEQLVRTNVSSAFQGVRQRSPVFLVVDSPVADPLSQIDRTKAALLEKLIFLNIIVVPQFFDTCALSAVDMAIYNLVAQSTGGVVLDLCDPTKAKKDNIELFINTYGQTFWRREVIAETKARNSAFIEKIHVNNAEETFYITGWSDQITDFTAVFSKGAIPVTLQTFLHLPQMTIFKISELSAGVYNLKFSADANVSYALIVAQPSQFDTWLRFSTDPSDDFYTSFANYGQTVHPVVHVSSALQGQVTVTATATAIGQNYSYSSSGVLRSSSCQFEYFFEKNFACPVNNGYFYFLVEVKSSDNVVIQRTLPGFCYGVGKQQCLNGGVWNGYKCSCPQPQGHSPLYSGDHCEFPVCQNGGILENMACTCPPLTSGKFCEYIQCRKWDYFTQLDKTSSRFSSIAFVVQNQIDSILVNTYLKQALPGFIESVDGAGTELQLSLVTFDDVAVTNVVSTPVTETFLSRFNAAVGQVTTTSALNKKGKVLEAIRSALETTMYKPAVFYVFTSTDTVFYSGITALLQNLAEGGVEVNIIFTPLGGPQAGNNYDFLQLIPAATNGRFLVADNTNVNELVSTLMKSMVFENGIVFDTVWKDCSSQAVSAQFPIETRSMWFSVIIRGPNNLRNLTVFDGKNNQITLQKSNIAFADTNTVILRFYRNKVDNFVGLWTIQTQSACSGAKCGCQIQTRVAGTLEARVGFAVDQYDDFVERSLFSAGAVSRNMAITAQVTNTLISKEEATMDEVRIFSRKLDLTNPQLLLASPFLPRDVNTCSNQFVTSNIEFPAVLTTMSLTVIQLYGMDENLQNFQRIQSFYNHKQDCGQFGDVNDYGRCVCKPNHQGFFCEKPICANGGTSDLSVCNCKSGFYGDFCQYRVLGSSTGNTTAPPTSTTFTTASTTMVTSTVSTPSVASTSTSTSSSSTSGLPSTTLSSPTTSATSSDYSTTFSTPLSSISTVSSSSQQSTTEFVPSIASSSTQSTWTSPPQTSTSTISSSVSSATQSSTPVQSSTGSSSSPLSSTSASESTGSVTSTSPSPSTSTVVITSPGSSTLTSPTSVVSTTSSTSDTSSTSPPSIHSSSTISTSTSISSSTSPLTSESPSTPNTETSSSTSTVSVSVSSTPPSPSTATSSSVASLSPIDTTHSQVTASTPSTITSSVSPITSESPSTVTPNTESTSSVSTASISSSISSTSTEPPSSTTLHGSTSTLSPSPVSTTVSTEIPATSTTTRSTTTISSTVTLTSSTSLPPSTSSYPPSTSTLVSTTPTTALPPIDCNPLFYSFYITFFFDTGYYGPHYSMQLDIPGQINNVQEPTFFNYYGISTNASSYYGTPFDHSNSTEERDERHAVINSNDPTKKIQITDALKHFKSSGDATFQNPAKGRTLVIFVADAVSDVDEAADIAAELASLDPPVKILAVGKDENTAHSLSKIASFTHVGNRADETAKWILDTVCRYNMS